jgi:hypothetical protein
MVTSAIRQDAIRLNSPPDAAGRSCRAGTLLIELPSCLQTRIYLYPLRGIPFHPPDRASELNLALDPAR